MAQVGAALGLGLTIVLLATVAVFDPTPHETAVVLTLAATNAVGIAALVWLVPWQRVPDLALLAFPISGLAGMALLGLLTTGITPSYGVLTVTVFLYVGVTQRPGTSLWLLPIALPAWLALDESTIDPWVDVPITVLVWALVGEITARRGAVLTEAMDELEDVAERDQLTGLLNRRTMRFRLSELRAGDALLLLDVDHFKRVNDEHGHEAGDRVLASLGRLIMATIRDQDSAIRYGGEEMLVLLPGSGLDGADRFDHRLRAALNLEHPAVTYSAGLTMLGPRESAAAAFRRADEALYRAKAQGRARTVTVRPPSADPARRASDPRTHRTKTTRGDHPAHDT